MEYLQLAILEMQVDATRQRILELREEVMDMDNIEAELTLGLQDVLAEMDTPAGSDSEDDEPVCGLNATDRGRIAALSEADLNMASELLQKMKSVKAEPTFIVPFAQLYNSRSYRVKAERKMKKLARFLDRANFHDSFSDESYWRDVIELQNTYPERDGRPGLIELVAFFYHQKKKYEFFFGGDDEEDSEGEEGDTEEEEEGDDDDDDDDEEEEEGNDQEESVDTDADERRGNAPMNEA